MKQFFRYFIVVSLFICNFSQAQEGTDILAVRGTIGDRLVYQFVGTAEDIAAQCVGGFTLMQFTDPILENDAIPHWTANGEEFAPALPTTHDIVCANILDNARVNEMASIEAQYRMKGIIDEQYEYEIEGNFIEVLELAEAWVAENQIEFAFIITVDTWDGRTVTYENLLQWSGESIPLIMRALSIFIEPETSVNHFELY